MLANVAEMEHDKTLSLHPGPIRSKEVAGACGDILRRKPRALWGLLVSSFPNQGLETCGGSWS